MTSPSNAVLEHLERFGSTTRIRRDGGRLHPDTGGLTMATFRQTTSRADDPQIHTHAVISAKVQTDDGRWWALDARYLKRHQRMLGGLYQSVLRSELTHRFGVAWGPIVNGQAEIAGMPKELMSVFSKRSADIDVALAAKVDEFRRPSRLRAVTAATCGNDPRSVRRHAGPQVWSRCRRSGDTVAARGSRRRLDRRPARRRDGSSSPPADTGRAVDGWRGRGGGVGAALVVGSARRAAGDL